MRLFTKFLVFTLLFPFIFFWSHPLLYGVPLTIENEKQNINRNRNTKNPSEYYGDWQGHTYEPSPGNWQEIPVYHLITDRFFDGNPFNNDAKDMDYDPSNRKMRHGGDFLGIEQKLDYIKSLGFTAIWISPIFENPYGSYHGYEQRDFTLLEEQFGTLEDFRSLVQAAHSRGMYVIPDIVVNHMSSLYYNEGYPNGGAPFRFHKAEYLLLPKHREKTYADFSVDNTFESSGNYCDVYDSNGIRHVDSYGEGSFWKSDFHHNGDLTNYRDPWNVHFGQIYGKYNDLRLCSALVQNKIIAMTKSLVASTDIDAIRIDTPMQVPLQFFKKWIPQVKEFAASNGKDRFLMFGELYTTRAHGATMIGRGKTPNDYGKDSFIDSTFAMDGGINYGFYKYVIIPMLVAKDPLAKNNLSTFLSKDLESYDLYDPKTDSINYRMLNFFGSHDQRRMASNSNGKALMKLASSLTALFPGIPIFYQGDEQGLCSYGSGLDGEGREDMMTSLAWTHHPACEAPNPAIKNNFDMTNPIYLYISRLMNIRRSYQLLKNGHDFRALYKDNEFPGIQAFTRSDKDNKQSVVLVFNFDSKPRSLKFLPTPWHQASIINKLNSNPETYFTDANGNIRNINISPYETKILINESEDKDLTPYVLEVTPQHDSTTSLRPTVTIAFSEPIDIKSVGHSIKLDNQIIKKFVFSDDHRRISFSCTVQDGIHKISIDPNIESLKGKRMFSGFESRFLTGNDSNILINPEHRYDNKLINNGLPQTFEQNVLLHHKAKGATYYRVSNDNRKTWSNWKPYASQSDWRLSDGGGWKEITVQYWADGSGAYYVSDGIDCVYGDGITDKDY